MDVFFTLDLIGTAVFAYTGSVAAKRQGFHFLGVFYISFLTAVGGGTVRSVLLQSPDLFWMKSSAYLLVVTTVVAASYLLRLNTNRLWFYLLDSLSLAVFVALGLHVTLQHGQPLHIAFAMGILTGIGGGLIRDAITSQPPQALSDPVYPVMMLTAAAGCLLSVYVGMDAWVFSCAGVLMVALLNASYNYFRNGSPAGYWHLQSRMHHRDDNIMPSDSARRFTADTRHRDYGTAIPRGRTINHRYHERRQPAKQKSAWLASTRALGVIGLACVVGFYWITPPSASTTAAGPAAPISTTADNFQQLLSEADRLLENHQIDDAEPILAELNSRQLTDTRLAQLNADASKLRNYHDLLDKAELALLAQQIPELQALITEASRFGFREQRFKAVSTGLMNARERASIETEKQLLTEKSFQLHLANASHHLASGDLALASAEVDLARSFGMNEDSLNRLARKIESHEQRRAAAIRETDIDNANAQFEQLLQAIELRNSKAIASLTTGTNRDALFSALFERYIEINASVTGLSIDDGSRFVNATLQLDNMRLPNGNLTYPPSSYAKIHLSLKRTQQGWSKIQW